MFYFITPILSFSLFLLMTIFYLYYCTFVVYRSFHGFLFLPCLLLFLYSCSSNFLLVLHLHHPETGNDVFYTVQTFKQIHQKDKESFFLSYTLNLPIFTILQHIPHTELCLLYCYYHERSSLTHSH